MAITLNGLTFDEAHTTVREKYEEVGGRNERRITLVGLILGEHSVEDIEARLGAILDAASDEAPGEELSLRTGRRLSVRRDRFTREVSREALTGSFVLELLATDPYEESVAVTSEEWSITASGAAKAFASEGTVFAKPTITLVATGNAISPAFSDGARTITYEGALTDGQTLVFDSGSARASLDGEDVTPYCSGLFPRIDPEGTTLTYTDDPSSSHTAEVTVVFRDRWW